MTHVTELPEGTRSAPVRQPAPPAAVGVQIPLAVDRLCFRYPSVLVDAVVEHVPGCRLVAIKNVTVNEEFFQGHFPGTPLMPGVLMIETLTQAAALLVLGGEPEFSPRRVWLRGVDHAKFRRQVVPGDQVRLEVEVRSRRPAAARVRGIAHVGDQVVAEAQLLLGITSRGAHIHPSACVHPGARIGDGCVIGPHAFVGEHVRLGEGTTVGASAVVDGWTEIGRGNKIFPFASVGLVPQDLKFHGELSGLSIGDHNTFREFVTVHRGTEGGGGRTSIGDGNLFMATAHVAHDCRIGSGTIFGNGATLGGHVSVEDNATISAYSGVHQFCRVGRHAFVGGFSVVTKDALPYGRTVGNRARLFGVNTIGLVRRGIEPEVISQLRRAYRYLLQSKLNTTQALAVIEEDPLLACAEVRYLVDFIRRSERGVTLRRAARRQDQPVDE